MVSTYYYETALHENNGVELNLGMVNTYEFVLHAFKWTDIRENITADNQDQLMLVYCLCRIPGEPLEEYGIIAMSTRDLPKICQAVQNVAADLNAGKVFVRDPESTYRDNYEDRDWLANGLDSYGGELVHLDSRSIQVDEQINMTWECLAHVHQWLERDLERKPIRYNLLITGYGRDTNDVNAKYDSNHYGSIMIPLDKVESFVSFLENFKELMQ